MTDASPPEERRFSRTTALFAGLFAGIVAGLIASLVAGLPGFIIAFIIGVISGSRATLLVTRSREQPS